jgi:NAD(P)H-dependent FMN reductase
MRLLAISGSLRAESTNTALLRELQRFTPRDVEVVLYTEMGELPIFNPDLEGSRTPAAVLRLTEQLNGSDGLVVCSPEYAHGIPGGLKNLFDWLTSRSEVVDKPILLLHASHRGDVGLAALHEVLSTLSSKTMPEVSVRIPLLSLSPQEIGAVVDRKEYTEMLSRSMAEFVATIRE